MELDFTADQEELRDTVRAVLAAECPPALVRELVEARVAGKTVAADGLWEQMVELGWPALTVPEAAGGLGLGAVELAVVVEELGRALAPGPLLPTISQFVPGGRARSAPPTSRRASSVPSRRRRAPGRSRSPKPTGSVDPSTVAATATPGAPAATR